MFRLWTKCTSTPLNVGSRRGLFYTLAYILKTLDYPLTSCKNMHSFLNIHLIFLSNHDYKYDNLKQTIKSLKSKFNHQIVNEDAALC